MRTVVVLGFAHLSISEKIGRARSVVTSMTGNPAFATPSPALTVITAAINACDAAYVAALKGSVDDTANMHAKEAFMEMQLRLLCNYVEGIANANPATAEAVVLSAGLRVKAKPGRVAREFHATATEVPGEVKLVTRFVQRATFIWQMCTDASLAAWETIGQATRGSMLKTGLIPGHVYYFRVAVVDKDGQGPWSEVMSAMAH